MPTQSCDQQDPPMCATCGYNLTGLEGRTPCPECGSEIDWAAMAARPHRDRSDDFRLPRPLRTVVVVLQIVLLIWLIGAAAGILIAALGWHRALS